MKQTKQEAEIKRLKEIIRFMHCASEFDECWCGEYCEQMPPEDRNPMCEAIRKILDAVGR